MPKLMVQKNEDGDLFIELPYTLMQDVGFTIGDTLVWSDNHNGSFSLSKQETEWVLVETISTYRMRYMVEVPKGKSDYALDTVVMEEAKEFSQKHLGEQIVSHRVISKLKAHALYEEDNEYTKSWDYLTSEDTFLTKI